MHNKLQIEIGNLNNIISELLVCESSLDIDRAIEALQDVILNLKDIKGEIQ